ncbi:hypothetical protein QYM36_003404 [Artemia franciscana]|nr:hypothetical protein QYM36_003404 [Artemia franciscana]
MVLPRLPLNLMLKGNVRMIPYIVGGAETVKGEVPFQLSLADNYFGGLSHFCGGSVLNEKWGITAAHCCDGSSPGDFVVVAGEHDRSVDDGDEQQVEVNKIIMHPDYNAWTIYNDICLLEFATPLSMNDMVQGLPLPAQMQEYEDQTPSTVTGWGTLSSGSGSLPQVLHAVNVPIVTDEYCRAAYGESDVADHMICAGVPEGGVDSCQGDSGGPLFGADGAHIGVVSWGYGCAYAGYPGVYTQVSYFVDWINMITA